MKLNTAVNTLWLAVTSLLLPTTNSVMVDFANMAPGQKVTRLDESTIVVTTQLKLRKFQPSRPGMAMVFDSSHPTGGDWDLGSPNQAYGGPGIGKGGRPTAAFPNTMAHGHVLIISEDFDSYDPDDSAKGGSITLEFLQHRYVDSFGLLDSEEGVTVKVYAFDRNATIVDQKGGDNSYQLIHVGIAGVYKMELVFHGSAAITHFALDERTACPPIVADPTKEPTRATTTRPTRNPTSNPTVSPVVIPTKSPTRDPTTRPTRNPTSNPTFSPVVTPTDSPTRDPTTRPTRTPSSKPTDSPVVTPTDSPTRDPTTRPTRTPTSNPTDSPVVTPTDSPTLVPTAKPAPTSSPTKEKCVADTKRLDFDKYAVGDKVGPIGLRIGVVGRRKGQDTSTAAIVLNSSKTSGKLGSPHKTFGGPGNGNAGKNGNEDDDLDHPVPSKEGGYFTFNFKNPLTVEAVGLLNNEEGVEFVFATIDDKTISIGRKATGQNSYENAKLGITGVTRMKVKVFGPTGITHLVVTAEPSTCNT